jgi:hypothetical protein
LIIGTRKFVCWLTLSNLKNVNKNRRSDNEPQPLESYL